MLVALPSAGCAASAAQSHAFKLDRPALRDLAQRQRGGEVLFEHQGEVYQIREGHDAKLELATEPCLTWQEEWNHKCFEHTLPLAQVGLSSDDELLPDHLPLDRVASATLRIENYVPPGWEPEGWARDGWVPKWGIGAAILGPAVIVAVDGQWFPVEELALQAGVSLAVGGFHVGARARALPSSRWCPWIGGSASGYLLPPSQVEPSTDSPGEDADPGASGGGALAARLGVDVGFNDHTFLVSPEIDLLFPLGQEYLAATSVTPWGGLTFTALY